MADLDLSLFVKGAEVFVANPYPEDDDKYFKAHLPNSSRPLHVPAVVESAPVSAAQLAPHSVLVNRCSSKLTQSISRELTPRLVQEISIAPNRTQDFAKLWLWGQFECRHRHGDFMARYGDIFFKTRN